MGYIPGFEYDIFISYAHVDNLTAFGEETGWIEQFHHNLQIQLIKRVGRADILKIWRDEQLDGNQLFDEVIKERVDKSAIFIALTSIGYLESEYCQQELAWFHRKAERETIGLSIESRPRIVNVLLNNIPYKKWPEVYGRAAGFSFHDSEKPDEFGEPSVPATSLYKKQLRELVDALTKLIKSFSKPDSTSTEKKREDESKHCDVYIAEVADSLRSVKKRLKSKLAQQGITIFPDVPPPHESRDHKLAVSEAIKNTELSVHMLDELSGAEIVGETNVTYPQKQATLGLQFAKSQLIWVPRHLDIKKIEDEQQRDFLTDIENNIGKDGKYDFLRGTTDEVYRVIMDKIDELKGAQKSEAVAASALLDIHEKDEPLVLDITRSLLEKNIIPYINPYVNTPAENIELLKERLKRVHAVIIIYGKVNSQWVVSRLEETVKIAMIEKIPIRSFCIYLAPPEKGDTDIYSTYSFLKFQLLDNQKGFDPASLQPLYTDLGLVKGSH